MAKNFIQLGNTVTVIAPAGGVAGGEGVLIGNLFGVAANTAAAGRETEIDTVGVFELPKLASDTIALGQRVYWDATDKRITEASTGNYPVGAAVAAAGAGAAMVRVRLDGVSTSVAA